MNESARASEIDVPAVDQPAAEAALRRGELVEMDARGVLIEPRRDLVLGLLDGDAVDVVDLLADRVVAEAVRAAGEREVVGLDVDRRTGAAEQSRLRPRSAAAAHDRRAPAPSRRAFAPSPSAHIRAPRCRPACSRVVRTIDDAGLAAGVLLEPDHLGHRAQRVAGIDRREERQPA